MKLLYAFQMNLLHIPSWRWDKANCDVVICINELKNYILAQNCLAPGIATLLSNLFTLRSYKVQQRGPRYRHSGLIHSNSIHSWDTE